MSRIHIVSFFMLLFVAAGFVLLSLPDGAAAQEHPPYKCYEITGPAPTPTPVVDLETRFGVELGVVVGQPAFLCDPAVKTFPPATPTAPLPTDTPYKAYNITNTLTVNRRATLTTQLGIEEDVLVGQAKYLAQPAEKDGVGDLTQTPWKCYQITDVGTPSPNTVNLLTQFGLELNVHVDPAEYLCEPAKKNGVGNLWETAYKCYAITTNAHDPPDVVNLVTQFGTEPNVAVGLARYLCEPVETSVGGVAQLPEAASDSGSSAGTYAALAGGLAAAFVALTAGAWYARRRWVK